MITEKANIYIDEFGNTALNIEKEGTFSHFIYCSVVIKSSDKEKAETLRKKICKDHNLGSDIKSSNLGNKFFDRRVQILNDLKKNLDFTVDVLVIDKSKLIQAEGLKRKKIFYKYFQNLFVSKYVEKYKSFSIYADRVGEEFKFELNDYIINKSIKPDLFNTNSFVISDDKTEKLIQLADIICGSIGKLFCTSNAHDRGEEIYELLHTRMSVEYFPYSSTTKELKHFSNENDKKIYEITLNTINDIKENLQRKNRNEELELLNYLVLSSKINSERLIPTYDITKYLSNFFDNMSDEKTRTLIRTLRYDGIFIISHVGKPGYKLANPYWDITQQFNHYLMYINPMLKKIKILNNSIANNTINSLNILESDPSFQELKQMMSGSK